jgi:hypothetical protein
MSYNQFRTMKSPDFTKAEEPLEADSFIRALEVKFFVFVLPRPGLRGGGGVVGGVGCSSQAQKIDGPPRYYYTYYT